MQRSSPVREALLGSRFRGLTHRAEPKYSAVCSQNAARDMQIRSRDDGASRDM